ncbi:MAG TPA: zinc ribbon domain-containing protein [Terriglobales bacterium]|nr:zinc ribbon domain-containing protein [Terriglobales bacterium]
MANCAQCGAEAADAAQFCPSCGLRLPRPAQPEAEEAAGPRWRRGRRVVVGFLATVVVLAAVFIVTVVYLIRHTTIVTSSKGGSRVEAPFGVVTTSNDPAKLAKSLAIDVYPGAVGERSAQADLVTNNMVSLQFRSQDAPRRVISFYHVRYPDATFRALPGGGYSLVQLNGLDTLTIQATPDKGATLLTINDIKR